MSTTNGNHNRHFRAYWSQASHNKRPTQQDMATLLNVDEGAFIRMVAGHQALDFNQALKLSKYLDVDIKKIWDADPLEGMKTLSINQIEDHLAHVDQAELDRLEANLERLLEDDRR